MTISKRNAAFTGEKVIDNTMRIKIAVADIQSDGYPHIPVQVDRGWRLIRSESDTASWNYPNW